MKKSCRLYYVLCLVGVLLLGAYPLYMGACVIADMLQNGVVSAAEYPKYLIPYTPITLSVLVGALLMPLLFRFAKRCATAIAGAVSLAAFLASELLLENLVLVTENAQTTLESWQMFMCYIPPEGVTTLYTPIEILIGNYSPWFKLHFYVIAAMLILSCLGILYGFGRMIASKDRVRLKPLVIQSVATAAFLAMCILACFTAFFRTGELQVSPLSAVLMAGFFVLLGLVAGLYLGSFWYDKRPLFAVAVPSLIASAATLLMYIGEMCLLDGHLYQLGTGAFFEARGVWTLAPADVVIVLTAGAVCALILWCVRVKKTVA